MSRRRRPSALVLASVCLALPAAPALAQNVLTGDTRLACEAILCLLANTRPHECTASLQRYFSIRYRYWSNTLQARRDFLNQCPRGEDRNTSSVVDALANGAGQCDADSLNANTWLLPDTGLSYIPNVAPANCAALYAHPYASQIVPVYLGDPYNGGRWYPPGTTTPDPVAQPRPTGQGPDGG